MRVIQFLIGGFGGAERFYVKLLSALGDYGVEQLAVHNEHANLVAAVAKSGVPATAIPFQKGRDTVGRQLYLDTLASFKPDAVIHWMNRAARRAETGDHVNIGRLGGFYPVRYYWKCDHLVANTPQIYDDICAQGWPAQATRMISNFGELTPEPAAKRAALDVPEDAFMLLALGRFDPWKSFDVLISALKHLPENTYLCLAGMGARASLYRAHAISEGVAHRVRFLGWRDDQAALLKTCDLCVVPSHHEPLGNVILEAWSLGAPVVAAASEGPSWLISHGDTGMLAEPKNVSDLAEKISEVQQNAKLRQRIAANGNAKWANEFSKDIICRQYVSFLEEAIAAPRVSRLTRISRLARGLAPLPSHRPSQKDKEHTSRLQTYLRVKTRKFRKPRVIAIDGVKLEVNRKHMPPDVVRALYKERYEKRKSLLVREVVRPGDRVLEIGAGTGFISVLCAQRCGADAVLSFEANPANLPIIRRNFELNGITPQLRGQAISASGGKKRLYVAPNLLSSSLLEKGTTNGEETNKQTNASEEIETCGIAEVINEFRPNCITMDVGGAEAEILKIAPLDGVVKIIVATHEHVISKNTLDEMSKHLKSHGFEHNTAFETGRVHLYLRTL
ncbi:MAG: FkbM family methyltransferase [Alphaproteobacteria bacterium]